MGISIVVPRKNGERCSPTVISFQGNWIDHKVEKRPTTLPNRISPRIQAVKRPQSSSLGRGNRFHIVSKSGNPSDRTDLLMLGYCLGKCSLMNGSSQIRPYKALSLL